MVPAGLRWSLDGRGGVRSTFDSGFPRHGCVLGRVAKTHLTSFSFRAFRFATRCTGGRSSLYQTRPKAFRVPVGADALIGPLRRLSSTTGPAAAKREAAQCDNHPDAVGTIRRGTAVPTWQKIIACPKARQNRSRHRSAAPRRAEGHCTGARQSAFSLPPDAAHSLFGATKKRMGGAPPWEQPLRGAPPRKEKNYVNS